MAPRPIMIALRSGRRDGATAMVAALALAAVAAAPALAAAPLPPPAAFALTGVGTNSAILLHTKPGRVVHRAVSVRNLSHHRITVILQAADIENATNGNAEYVTTHLHRAGRWLHLSAKTAHLAPGAVRQVTYTVRVPAGITGASHYAGIVAINAADLARPAIRGRSKRQAIVFYRISRQALPLTIRTPGRLSRSLVLQSVKVSVSGAGASLVLGLLPGGTELTERAPVRLRVLRGGRTIFTYASSLGQLFPGGGLRFPIPWRGRPTPGTYRLLGQIRPQGSRVINIDQTIGFTAANAAQLKHDTPPVAQAPGSGTPGWLFIVLAGAVALLGGLSLAIWRLRRRLHQALA